MCRYSKIIAFQLKITHRILACKYNLEKWKIAPNTICNECNLNWDMIEHHRVACPATLKLWNQYSNFPIDTYDIIVGIINRNDDPIINHRNVLIVQAKYYI